MFSPPAELALDAAHAAVRNLIRDAGDPDGDTISECIRTGVEALGPVGPYVLAGVLTGSALGFWWHICRPILEETR